MEETRYKRIQEFETMRSGTLRLALGAAVLHKAATWLGGAAVTWATVVLLGGFASQLAISDFVTITLLVLRIIFLLALALFTCKLVTKKSALSTGSLHPLQLTYCDPLLSKINCVKFASIIFQCFFLIGPAFNISASEIHKPFWHSLYSYVFSKPLADNEAALPSLQACLQSYATINHSLTDASALRACSEFCFPAQNSTTASLPVCMFTFHFLVIATCFAAALCNVYIFICVAKTPKSLSLARYHDEVLSRGLSIELVEADAFDWRDFLLRSVGDDLVVRNIAPLEVKRQNEDFIEYLFYYPKGVEMVMGMLASENSLLQQTAANMPGFWSFNPRGMEKHGMELLSRLGDRLGLPGKVAEGAANSLKSLAIAWRGYKPSPLLKVYVSRSGGGEPTNAVSRSGGGSGDGSSSSSIRTESTSNVPSSSAVAGRGGSGTSESSSEGGEGHGRSQSRGGGNGDTDSVSGGPGEGAGESMSTLPESSDTISGSSQGAGQGAAAAAAADGSSNISEGVRNGVVRSGGSGGGRGEQEWNVVQKVVDLVANKRLPTLQVYVRALDSFFMSESVKNSLTTEERKGIKTKLLKIIHGHSNRASANADEASVRMEWSTKARTRLLAFSALDRLTRESDDTWVGEALLNLLDGQLNQGGENFVIWVEEKTRYIELCDKYNDGRRGEWLTSGRWVVRYV